MSDSTSIASLLSQNISSTTNGGANSSANIKIISLPPDLQVTTQAQNLPGEIVAIDENGNVTIRTEQGNITIQTDQAARLQNGDAIEIRIEAGNPPINALLRPSQQLTTQIEQPAVQTSLSQGALPQPLTLAQLTSGAILSVIPYDVSQGISLPHTEEIISSLTSLPATTETAIINTSDVNNKLLSTPITQSKNFKLPDVISAPTTDTDRKDIPSKLVDLTNAPTDKIPFREVAAQLLGVSPKNLIPLKEDDQAPKTQHQYVATHEKLSRIEINKIDRPTPEIHLKNITLNNDKTNSADIIRSRIGEVSAILEGFTQSHNFAVFRITDSGDTANHHYALNVPIEELPVGSTIKLSIKETASNLTTTAPSVTFTPSYFLTPEIWPIFQETEQALAHTNPQAAQVFNAVLPSAAAPAQMGASVLFFVAAMRTGDVQGWLGDKAIETLKLAGKADIIGRLGNELSNLARLNSETLPGDWKALSIPLAWQNDIHKVAVYTRKEDQDDNSPNGSSKGNRTRFVMDLNLSNMGQVQLDGLFTGNASDSIGRLDLVLRTEQSFTQAMKQQMRTAYKNALDETKITGELSFQDHMQDWVRITADAAKEYTEDI